MKNRRRYRTIQIHRNLYKELTVLSKKTDFSMDMLLERMFMYFKGLPRTLRITAHLRLDENGKPFYDVVKE